MTHQRLASPAERRRAGAATHCMLRIALAHSHAETLGGGERALLALAEGLSARHQVRLLLGRFVAERTYAELGRYRQVRLRRLHWLWRRLPDDAVVANSFGANLLALRNGPRVAYWVHSTRSVFLQSGAERLDLRLRRALDWMAVHRAGLLIANSAFTAERIRALYRRGADEVVYPGVDLEQFHPAPASSGAYAITVGRLAPEKGVDRLLRLWRQLPELPLVVVGDGQPAVVRGLRALAPANVTFVGPAPPAEVARWYQGARLGVFTPYAEELGIAPLEAMASELPVVAWRQGGLVETIVDGLTGYLVADDAAFRDRVRAVYRDDLLRRELGRQARARAERFSWGRTVAQMEAVCQRLARSDRSPLAPTPPG